MKKLIVSICLGISIMFLFTSCASLLVKWDNLENESTRFLCSIYHNKFTTPDQREKVVAELNNRNAIKQWEWDRIKEGMIQVGMSKFALYASCGLPWKENVSVGTYGRHIQHVYGNQYSTYVYTRNGKITSWQY